MVGSRPSSFRQYREACGWETILYLPWCSIMCMPRLAYSDCNLCNLASIMAVVLSSTEAMSSGPKSSSLTNNKDSMASSSPRE